jgi:hypothetical protein
VKDAAARVPKLAPIATACGVAVVCCAAWALWPLPTPAIDEPSMEVKPGDAKPAKVVPPIDLAAFHAPLWVAPPPPPAPPAPTPPAPPLRLQLIAILREGEGTPSYKAAIYDPDQDKLLIVGKGETIAGHLIEDVRAGDLTLKDNGNSRTLSLKDEGAAR